MSEFTNNYEYRAQQLADYMAGLIQGENGVELIQKYQLKTENFIPKDILGAFDILMEQNFSIQDLKAVSNKLFNILYETLNAYPALQPRSDSFLAYLMADNAVAQQQLKALKPLIKELNQEVSEERKSTLKQQFTTLDGILQHYVVVENVVFPFLEKKWKHHRCVQIMWSFHDDIRRNLQLMDQMLTSENFEIKKLNELVGLIFFNISTIILREEKIIVPVLLETANGHDLENMLAEAYELEFSYVKIPAIQDKKKSISFTTNDLIHLSTGVLSAEQFQLIFNHLPVDITFVDENDEVKFFSNPPHRIFPRTPAIIGRKVQFCHPPESVHIVNRIVDSFKSGEKSVASFWLHMGPKFVLIQYFAVRNEQGEYRGTLEVSQEISEIQKIEGDRRLLDW